MRQKIHLLLSPIIALPSKLPPPDASRPPVIVLDDSSSDERTSQPARATRDGRTALREHSGDTTESEEGEAEGEGAATRADARAVSSRRRRQRSTGVPLKRSRGRRRLSPGSGGTSDGGQEEFDAWDDSDSGTGHAAGESSVTIGVVRGAESALHVGFTSSTQPVVTRSRDASGKGGRAVASQPSMERKPYHRMGEPAPWSMPPLEGMSVRPTCVPCYLHRCTFDLYCSERRHSSQRDLPLELFHILGRLLYNKSLLVALTFGPTATPPLHQENLPRMVPTRSVARRCGDDDHREHPNS